MKLLLAVASVTLLLALPPAAVESPAAAQVCTFGLGFDALRRLILEEHGDAVGACLEDEHFERSTGDALQRTAGGLFVWRKADNRTTFTDGSVTWINGPDGLATRPNAGPPFPWEAPAAGPVPSSRLDTYVPTPGSFSTINGLLQDEIVARRGRAWFAERIVYLWVMNGDTVRIDARPPQGTEPGELPALCAAVAEVIDPPTRRHLGLWAIEIHEQTPQGRLLLYRGSPSVSCDQAVVLPRTGAAQAAPTPAPSGRAGGGATPARTPTVLRSPPLVPNYLEMYVKTQAEARGRPRPDLYLHEPDLIVVRTAGADEAEVLAICADVTRFIRERGASWTELEIVAGSRVMLYRDSLGTACEEALIG